MPNDSSEVFSSLGELIDAALKQRWCTKSYCTTCGSTQFRQALSKMPRQVIVTGLRSIEEEFLSERRDLVTTIFEQAAYFPDARDMLEPLAGTPAATFLEKTVRFEDERRAKRQEWDRFQAPEAVEQRRIQAKDDAAAKHAMRREQSADTFALIRSKFDDMPDRSLLREAFMADYRFNLGAVGGVLFGRLLSYYRDHQISQADLAMLDELASRHGGHWGKLREALIELQV